MDDGSGTRPPPQVFEEDGAAVGAVQVGIRLTRVLKALVLHLVESTSLSNPLVVIPTSAPPTPRAAIVDNGAAQAQRPKQHKSICSSKPRAAGWGEGRVVTLRRLETSFEGTDLPPRDVDVWLPACYDTLSQAGERFPVVYAHDGQNLGKAVQVDIRFEPPRLNPLVESARLQLLESTPLSSRWFQIPTCTPTPRRCRHQLPRHGLAARWGGGSG